MHRNSLWDNFALNRACIFVCMRACICERTLYEAAIRLGCSLHSHILRNCHIGYRYPRALEAFGLVSDGGVVCASGCSNKRAMIESFGETVGARALKDAIPWSVWPCVLAPWQGAVIITSSSTPIWIAGVDLHRAERKGCRTLHRDTKPFGHGMVPAMTWIMLTQVRYVQAELLVIEM